MPYTVVSFHAHPDDEALLTAGTLARAAAEGHRVVLVTATDGAAGLASTAVRSGGLATTRMEELHRAAEAIGCREVHWLGYADSGLDGNGTDNDADNDNDNDAGVGVQPGLEPGPESTPTDGATRPAIPAFSQADPEEAAARLAELLTRVGADVLTTYDPAGGYGHPDHVQVHRVGARAAALADTPVVLEATVDRRPLVRLLEVLARTGVLRVLGVDRAEWSPGRFRQAFADPQRITHRVPVRHYRRAKRAAMAAHASQATADAGVRTLAVFVRLPPIIFGRVFAHEWFVESGRDPVHPLVDDIFASLGPGDRAAGGRGR